MKKVGKDEFTYRKIKFDPGGWADAKKYRPEEYDLCYLKTKDQTYSGWWTGAGWDSSKTITEEILYWKKNSQLF